MEELEIGATIAWGNDSQQFWFEYDGVRYLNPADRPIKPPNPHIKCTCGEYDSHHTRQCARYGKDF